MTVEELKVIIKAEVSQLQNSLKSTKEEVKKTKETVTKETSEMGKAFQGLAKKFALAQLVCKGIENAIKAVVKAVKEGIGRAYEWSKSMGGSFASSMDKAKGALTNLVNSISTALIPIIEALLPIITKVANFLASAFTAIGKGISQLLGNKTFIAAAGGVEGYTEAVNDAKKATMGFDELNILKADEGSTEASGAFEEVDIGEANSTIEKIKTAFSKAKEFLCGVFQEMKDSFLSGFDFDTVKEKVLNTIDSVKKKFSSIKIDTSGFKKALNQISENTGRIFNQVVDSVSKIIDIIAGVMSSPEYQNYVNEVIPTIMELLNDVASVLIDLVGDCKEYLLEFWNTVGQPVYLAIVSVVGKIIDIIKVLWDNLLKPVIEYLRVEVKDLWDNTLMPLFEKHLMPAFNKVKTLLELVLENVIKPAIAYISTYVVPKIKEAIEFLKPIIQGIATVFGAVFDSIGTAVDILLAVFSGRWEDAWKAVKKGFTQTWYSIYNVFATIVNAILGAINSLTKGVIKGINGILNAYNSVADKLNLKKASLLSEDALSIKLVEYKEYVEEPAVTSGSTSKSTTSSSRTNRAASLMAAGGVVDKATNIIAGEDGPEAIVPLENNTQWIDKLAEAISNKNQTPTKIVLNLDGKEVAYATINNINRITRSTGNMPLVLA